jgi:glycosyltransferase involved in cell wall biosynthesis
MHIRGVARLDPRVRRAASALNEAGFSVSVVDIESERARSLEEDINGIHLKHILKPDWLNTKRFPWRLIRSVQKIIIGTFMLIRTPADIYHAHNDNALPACYIAAKLRCKPLVYEAHEMPLYPLEDTSHSWARMLITQLFIGMVRRCAGVITVSGPIIEELYNRYQITGISLIRNIPPYQVVPRSNRLRQYLGLSPEVRIALYQGNLQPGRGLAALVRAAVFLELNTVIVMMGKGVGSTPAELEALAVREGVTDRIKIMPPVPQEELLDWTASADIGLIASAPDYSLNIRMLLPNKLFEYLMAGLPVLSSPLEATARVVKTYDVGRVLYSLEPADIGAEINAMLTDRTKLERWRHNALEAAQHEFCWEKESLQLIHLYHTILTKQHARSSREQSLPNQGSALS